MLNPAQLTVIVVDSDTADLEQTSLCLESVGFRVKRALNGRQLMEIIYSDPPHCLVMEHGLSGTEGDTLLAELKADNVYGHLPVVLTIPETLLEKGIDWTQTAADDYVVKPFTMTELVSRVKLSIARSLRDVNANPLTGLPGNVSIMREAERQLASGAPFALAYVDVDNFKAFNDKYGFSRGDEVLRMTSRILVNAIRALESPTTYVGHVGGDDFVFLAPSHSAAMACRRIIEDFDQIVPNFYDESDRREGCIHSVDRKGTPQRFALMSLSIAVVDTAHIHVDHIGQLSARAAEVKHYAKQLEGSNFIIDRRGS